MMITSEKKREIDSEIAKFLRNLMAENEERFDGADVIDLKKFDVNDWRTHRLFLAPETRPPAGR